MATVYGAEMPPQAVEGECYPVVMAVQLLPFPRPIAGWHYKMSL